MLLFAHTGITLGAAALAAGTARNGGLTGITRISWWRSLGSYLDIRVLLIGSMLPDIIDKPVGIFFFPEAFGNGRIFAHTLLFFVVIALGGCWLYRSRGQTWLAVLAAGTFVHLLLDQMWQAPRTLFWPLLGLEFEKYPVYGWLNNLIQALTEAPDVVIPEVIGLVILAWFLLGLVRKRRVVDFIRYGRLG